MTTSWALFERLADRYDEVIPFFGNFAARLLDVLNPTPDTRVLDLGTGRGAIAGAALRRGCRVTAVDAAPRMIELVKGRFPEVDARTMDAADLDFANGMFDLVTAGFVIHLVDDPDRVLGELRRVIRPGGRVALTVPGPCAEDDGRWAAYNALVREFQSRAAVARSPGREIDVPQALRVAGFVEIERVSIEVHLPVPDPQTCWDFAMSHGFAGFVNSLAPADAAELRERALVELAGMHDDGGIVLDRGAFVHLARVPTDNPASLTAGAGLRCEHRPIS